MELVLLIGIQATGKSRFCREKLFCTHVRLNLDMLRTRLREKRLMEACIASKTKFVVDNTSLTREERSQFILPARAAGFRVIGYFFESRAGDCLRRNAARPASERIPAIAIRSAINRLELPAIAEGFDKLSFVRLMADNRFSVDRWKGEPK
jgi:predicted kinase